MLTGNSSGLYMIYRGLSLSFTHPDPTWHPSSEVFQRNGVDESQKFYIEPSSVNVATSDGGAFLQKKPRCLTRIGAFLCALQLFYASAYSSRGKHEQTKLRSP